MYLQIHGDNIIACSATEVADRIAVIEGLEEEQKSSAAQRCARIYAECNRKPGKNSFYYATSCLLYTSPSPRDQRGSRMPSSA